MLCRISKSGIMTACPEQHTGGNACVYQAEGKREYVRQRHARVENPAYTGSDSGERLIAVLGVRGAVQWEAAITSP